MRPRGALLNLFLPFAFLATLPVRVLATDVIQTTGFQSCSNDSSIQVQRLNINFDRSTKIVAFDVAGTSDKVQNVSAALTVYAYGRQVYTRSFNPCDSDTYVTQLCPVPAGNFSASGSQPIPDEYISMIPSIAFSVPDLDGEGRLELTSTDSNTTLACIQSTVSNGKTANVPAAKYAAVGIAGAALVVSGLSALSVAAGGAHAGTASASPTFTEVMGWFQSMAMNGMLSVQYPSIYRSFTHNFGFSTGLVPWDGLQTSIDNFRQQTGGNLTNDSVPYLRNSTLVYTSSSNHDVVKRGISFLGLLARQIDTEVNGTSVSVGNGTAADNTTATAGNVKAMHFVHGIEGYVEQLSIPKANTFMTILLVFAIAIAAITAGILLFKVILEAWALFGNFPKRLVSFRKRYWWLLAKTITNLILLLYGVWTMYCIYQFTNGDSWAAKILAGVTLGLFTALLLGFTFKIWHKAHQFKKMEGDSSMLYEDKQTWIKYSIFYDSYKKSYWWIFVPAIIYMFAKGCVIAGLNGHGLPQVSGQLFIEGIMMILLLWSRPYELKSGNWINICIQVVRVISCACILIFVEELNITQTTKTITGLVLIVVQSILTGVLAILIAVNAIYNLVHMNPHRKQRKEAEKRHRDLDNLTPLDARNSLLMYPVDNKGYSSKSEVLVMHSRGRSQNGYDMVPYRDLTPAGDRFMHDDRSTDRLMDRSMDRSMDHSMDRSLDRSMSRGGRSARSLSPPDSMHRQPQLPDVEFKGVAV